MLTFKHPEINITNINDAMLFNAQVFENGIDVTSKYRKEYNAAMARASDVMAKNLADMFSKRGIRKI